MYANLRTTCRCTIWLIHSRNKHVESSKATLKNKRYTDTVNLPKFPFPLFDDLAAKRELEIQKTCNFEDLYQWQAAQLREKSFVLHDGPPYANGKTHVGHAVNKILKDITIRYKLLKGYKIHFVPGWDCHGLPIEMKALTEVREQLQQFTPIQICEKARSFAKATMHDQLQSFKRWGVMGDWSSCYATHNTEYQDAQLDVFYKIFDKGLIFRDTLPVYWSPSSRTALAEAELEYNEEHKSTSVYVRFPFKRIPQQLQNIAGSGKTVSAIVWTTTPWTLPFNKAICYSQPIKYACLKDTTSSELFLCDESFTQVLSTILNRELVLVGSIEGHALEGATYTSPLEDRELPFLPGHHVVRGKGTGLVHTAPAHGRDDFQVALRHGLAVDCSVDEMGCYKDSVRPELKGKVVGKDADEAVIELLGNNVLKMEPHVHSYPYDWRTKQPVIIRTSKQWFVNLQKLKEQALTCLKDVQIIPRQAEHGMVEQLKTRPYWCISRQRVWGVPIPAFYHRITGEHLLTRETVDHLREVFKRQGTDAWWVLPISQLLPESILSKLGKGSPEDYVKGEDILDIWFDSGVSWASVLQDVGNQADMYLEGQDQFGGWFQTSLLTSVAVQGRAPYKTLLVHGFTTDENGKKMSKSVGNVVDPEVVINGGLDKNKEPAYGVEVLRLWVAHSHHHTNIMIGPSILTKFNEALFKVRISLRYLLGSLHDFDPSVHSVPYESLLPQDKYMLHLLYEIIRQTETFYDECSYNKVIQTLEHFVYTSLSSFYLRITKDRCYCGDPKGLARRSCQTTQHNILKVLIVVMAPILPHLMEEVHSFIPESRRETDLLFHGRWPDLDNMWHNPELIHKLMPIFAIRDSINNAIGQKHPFKYDVAILASDLLQGYLKELQTETTSCVSPLCEILTVSHTSVLQEPPSVIPEDSIFLEGTSNVFFQKQGSDDLISSKEQFKIVIMPALHHKCERCRLYTAKSASALCERCLDVLANH